MDKNLTSKSQIKSFIDKASRASGFLKYAKIFLPEEVIKNLYNNIFEPHFRTVAQNRAECIVTDGHFHASNIISDPDIFTNFPRRCRTQSSCHKF